jgi:hypothetical protein
MLKRNAQLLAVNHSMLPISEMLEATMLSILFITTFSNLVFTSDHIDIVSIPFLMPLDVLCEHDL